MSEKLSERMCNNESLKSQLRPGSLHNYRHYHEEVAALEQQLAAKDAEIARLRELLSNRLPHQLESAALAETPAAPREPRVILPPHVKQGFCDRHNRKWEEIDTGDGFAFTCRECRNERIKNHDAPLTALALPEDDVPDTADLAETPATPIRQCRCDVDKGYRDPGCVHCICQSVSDLNGQQRLDLNSDCSKHGAAPGRLLRLDSLVGGPGLRSQR